MPLLVYITGKLGAGKSSAAETWGRSNGATTVKIDRILEVGGRKYDPKAKDPWNWGFWKILHEGQQQERYLEFALNSEHKDLKGHPGDLVVEGSILCKDWFYDAFEKVLLEWIAPIKRDRHYFYLIRRMTSSYEMFWNARVRTN